jgi:hypothetical protein
MLSKTNGICTNCNHSFPRRSAFKHLETCVFSKNSGSKNICYLIEVADDTKAFWLYVLMPINNELISLDRFLRDLWLECCGHMSAFTIAGKKYLERSLNPEDKSMHFKIGKVLSPGTKCTYEYDFGSTTELVIEVIKEVPDVTKKAKLLIRNVQPAFNCQSCKTTATLICSCCQTLTCERCIKQDPCETADYFLPVLNSPRTGTCGLSKLAL